MHFLIYQITNLINNKIYVGAHQTKDEHDSYFGSGKAIKNAIAKYGVDKFKREIIHRLENEEEMYLKESEIVTEDFINRQDTYNIRTGGRGGWGHLKGKPLTDSHRNKIRLANLGRVISPSHRAAMSGPRPGLRGEGNPFFGKKHSVETKTKIANRPYPRGKDHFRHGKPTPASFKAGALHPRAKEVTVDGALFGSMAEASRLTGRSKRAITLLLASSLHQETSSYS